ncbi:GlcG/HbpS family heme-binding protein [Nocardia pseudovaccinii]|uniref:GlcG/HbpS family heme-binding protein n=1 Tax=Nocardia pseudovaccinii TaxID=189540 RepID=UPI0007A5628D|nr:heme-binding protein [Nocardia pseudovaccinii]
MQQKIILSLRDAKAIADVAEKFAIKNGLQVAIVVVDESTHIQYAVRMDGAGLMTADAALAKARSAAGSGFPTTYWAKVLQEGGNAVLTIPGVSPVPGGVPIIVDGRCAGAVGVSGAPPHLDVAVAEAGATAVTGDSAERAKTQRASE